MIGSYLWILQVTSKHYAYSNALPTDRIVLSMDLASHKQALCIQQHTTDTTHENPRRNVFFRYQSVEPINLVRGCSALLYSDFQSR
jgi:hypothetical protein